MHHSDRIACLFDRENRSYGAVYKAYIKGTNRVIALKKQKIRGDLNEVQQEVSIMASIVDQYLVGFLGSKLATVKEDGLKVQYMWVCATPQTHLHTYWHLFFFARGSAPLRACSLNIFRI
jgi:hypothetical protein